MSEIKPINQDYVTVKEYLGVINHGNGYAIVHVHTGECLARNISSFLDCVKTIDHILGGQSPPPPPPPPPKNNELEDAIRGLKPDVQRLIRKYAPETVSVDKSTNLLSRSRYKCFDASGKVLGRVRRGKHGDRFWQYGGLSDQKHY